MRDTVKLIQPRNGSDAASLPVVFNLADDTMRERLRALGYLQ